MNDEFSENQNHEQSNVDAMKEFATLANNIFLGLKKCWEFLQGMRSETFHEITYPALIASVVKNKPNAPFVKRCAVMRKHRSDGYIELTVVYLDDLNEPVWGPDKKHPYGYRMRTKSMDVELTANFGNQNMLLLD